MRLGLRFSRPGPIGDEFLKVRGEFLHQGLETARGGRSEKQPATDLALDLVDRLGAVDLVGRSGVEMGVGGEVSGRGNRSHPRKNSRAAASSMS
jgi:hypothetical protein